MHHLHNLYAPLLLVALSWLALAIGALWLAVWEWRQKRRKG
jgi:hypothetical protein